MAESKWSKESIEQKSGGLDKKIYEFRPKGISPSDSEDIYVSIIESIEDGYYEVDLSGNFTFFNDSMARIIGYTRDELMGMNNRQYMDHYNAKKVFRAFNKVYLTGIPTKAFDWELIRKDGSRCFVEASVSLRRDSGNQPVGYFGIARDISQRKLMEQALKESEENYRNIIESIVDGYYEVDLSGNFTFFNESMARIIGYTRDELMGMNNRQYMDDYNTKKIFQAFNKVYLTGIPTKAFDWEVIRRDGSRCFLEVSACLKRDLTNQPIGFFGMARDITRRKKIAETLKAREKELEAKTKSLEEVNIALKVLLEKKNEEKAELETHVMSNVKELVLPYLEKVQEIATDDKQKTYLGVLESNLKAIVSPFSQRLSSKYLHLTSTEIEVANLVKQGRSTKEIADLLSISSRTVETHRKNIRKKVGLKDKKVSLRTYLLTIQ